jgi:hypothetical protein
MRTTRGIYSRSPDGMSRGPEPHSGTLVSVDWRSRCSRGRPRGSSRANAISQGRQGRALSSQDALGKPSMCSARRRIQWGCSCLISAESARFTVPVRWAAPFRSLLVPVTARLNTLAARAPGTLSFRLSQLLGSRQRDRPQIPRSPANARMTVGARQYRS